MVKMLHPLEETSRTAAGADYSQVQAADHGFNGRAVSGLSGSFKDFTQEWVLLRPPPRSPTPTVCKFSTKQLFVFGLRGSVSESVGAACPD